jgi:hypothetical protein
MSKVKELFRILRPANVDAKITEDKTIEPIIPSPFL